MPPKARPISVDRGLQGLLVDRLDGVGDVRQQLLGRDRGPGVLGGDLGVVLQVGLVVGLRLQLDVLLADRGAVADHGQGVGGDRVVVVVDVEVDVDALVGELELLRPRRR